MISYGGVPLGFNDAAAAQTVADAVSWPDLFDARQGWRPAGLMPRPVRVGSLLWPWGASRFAAGCFLATDAELARIRPLAYGANGRGWNPLALALDDRRPGRKVAPLLYLLPPRPLDQITGDNGLWLLTLVDDRYRWRERAADISVTPGVTTWAQLIAAIASALGVTITTDTIAAAYLSPSADLAGHYVSLPPLLDRALAACGQRLVRHLDGTVITQAPRTAKKSQDNQLAAWVKEKGGPYALAPARPTDLQALVPASVTVTFPDLSSGALADSPFLEPVTLAALALPEYAGVPGHNGTKLLSSAAAYDGANAAQLAALARQMARDYYLWSLGRQWTRFAGIDPYAPESLNDHAEWLSRGGECSTWVRRGRHDAADPFGGGDCCDRPSPVTGGGGSVPPCPPVPWVEYDTRCEAGVLNAYARTVTLLWVGGCLRPQFGAWILSHQAGSCAPAVTVNNTATTVTQVTTTQVGLVYLSLVQQLWFWTGAFWFEICPCAELSGSGSGSGACVPGVCSLCPDPPASWGLSVAGFSLACRAFNGDWTLESAGDCLWQAEGSYLGLPVTVTLTLASPQSSLNFVWHGLTDVLGEATYYADTPSPIPCCLPLSFGVGGDGCGCDPDNAGGGAAPESCPFCPVTPATWATTLAGYTGCYAPFNGTWVMTQASPCEWVAVGANGVRVALELAREGGVTLARLSVVGTGVAAGYVGALVGGDCCLATTLGLALADCPGGTGSANGGLPVTLTPSCVNQPAPCPATLTATPTCCGGSGSGTLSGGGGAGSPCSIDCGSVAGDLTATCTAGPACLLGTSWALGRGGPGFWSSAPFGGLCSMTASQQWNLYCTAGEWTLSGVTTGGGSCLDSSSPISVKGVSPCSASPFSMTFSGFLVDASCGGPSPITITVTP